jgi:hypothetical protein
MAVSSPLGTFSSSKPFSFGCHLLVPLIKMITEHLCDLSTSVMFPHYTRNSRRGETLWFALFPEASPSAGKVPDTQWGLRNRFFGRLKTLGCLAAAKLHKWSGLEAAHQVSDTLRVDRMISPALESPSVRLSLNHKTVGGG